MGCLDAVPRRVAVKLVRTGKRSGEKADELVQVGWRSRRRAELEGWMTKAKVR